MTATDTASEPRRFGDLVVEGWAGRVVTRVVIIGETPTRVRIRAITPTKLPRRWLQAGETALVPRAAVREQRRATTDE